MAIGTSEAIRDLIHDYKANISVKRAALKAFPAVAMPSRPVVSFLASLFNAPPVKMNTELVQTLGIFAKNCRQSVECVIACVDAMAALKIAASSFHQKIAGGVVTEDTEVPS